MAGEGPGRLHREGSVFRHIPPDFDAGDAPVLPSFRTSLSRKDPCRLKRSSASPTPAPDKNGSISLVPFNQGGRAFYLRYRVVKFDLYTIWKGMSRILKAAPLRT